MDVLNGKAELIVKPEQIKTQIQIIEAAMQSAISGQAIGVGLDEKGILKDSGL